MCIYYRLHTCIHACAPTHQHANVPVGVYVCPRIHVHHWMYTTTPHCQQRCTQRHLKLYAKTLHKDTSVQKDTSQ